MKNTSVFNLTGGNINHRKRERRLTKFNWLATSSGQSSFNKKFSNWILSRPRHNGQYLFTIKDKEILNVYFYCDRYKNISVIIKNMSVNGKEIMLDLSSNGQTFKNYKVKGGKKCFY